MCYEDLMREHSDANRAGLEIGFDNKEIMYYVFDRAYFICSYLSQDGFLDADDVYDVVEEFIDFYKEVMK